MKKVSCASRAGCDCGWKSESKFQKLDSTHLLVGISLKPISNKILRNSARTLRSGCKYPPPTFSPNAKKLYGLKGVVFHAPDSNISLVKSAALRCRTG